jgi:hypothetical protein
MATRKPKVQKSKIEIEEPVMIQETEVTVVEKPRRKWLIPVMLGILLLGLFWYKTNTWPIAAIVNGQPITRFELNKELYTQGGTEVLDGLITERLIKAQLSKENVQVSEEEISGRLDEIKTNLGENFELALSAQGLSEADLKEQIKTQVQIEKMLSDQATVSAEEVDALVKDFPSREEAEKFAKQQKLQGIISEWVAGLRDSAKIYVVGEKQAEE